MNLDDELENFRERLKLNDSFKLSKSVMVTDDGRLVIVGSEIRPKPEETSKDDEGIKLHSVTDIETSIPTIVVLYSCSYQQ